MAHSPKNCRFKLKFVEHDWGRRDEEWHYFETAEEAIEAKRRLDNTNKADWERTHEVPEYYAQYEGYVIERKGDEW
jgi:hypothetical protein